ncbi:type II secretion system minor pseudopilin GspK [Legionella spiritensis]|uniref:type II secretion system minor pseudopilin GspK n=1 Tax=Legionella spiritensis TaxID=452 RepID=UPI000F70F85A|nr:type II secretion system minor pseudopilin GspK [Legionella spiritensis]VEG90139.1 general secretion pathway protein K [Legionella spiritensis]
MVIPRKNNGISEQYGRALKGSALISALFIMTLVAIAATAMSTRLQMDIYRTRLTLLTDKLYLASQGVTFWAMSELSNKKNRFTRSDKQGIVALFPNKIKNIYPDFVTNGSLYDLQSRFNLNNLSEKAYVLMFFRLLDNLNLKSGLNNDQKKILLADLQSWISPYKPGRGNDERMNYYLKQKPPYFPSHQPLHSVTEFRLIRNVPANIYQGLANYITALPETTAININTASPFVLKALGNGLKPDQVNELMLARQENGITDIKKINPLLQKLRIRGEQVTLESQYFLSVAIIRHDELNLINYTILKRTRDKKGKISVSLISESLNTL